MNQNQIENNNIIQILSAYNQAYPQLRFAQLLASLDINQSYLDKEGNTVIRDNYYNTNETIMIRIQKELDKQNEILV